MSLEELLDIVQKSDFQKSLNKYGFKLVYKKREINDGYHSRSMIGFESGKCKLGIYYEPGGGISVMLGLISNSFDKDSSEWVGLEYVISYILKRPIKRGQKYTTQSHKSQIAGDISDISKDFELLGDQIISMFQDKYTIDKWMPELEEYIREDTRRRYNLK